MKKIDKQYFLKFRKFLEKSLSSKWLILIISKIFFKPKVLIEIYKNW